MNDGPAGWRRSCFGACLDADVFERPVVSSLPFGSISRAHTSDFECLIADLIEPQRLVRPGQVGPQDLAGVRAHHRIPARADLRLRSSSSSRRV